ncbi:MAG: SAM-dependent DNA methyltransferase, partial [Rhabdochlamydiaceae bacterium]
HSQHYQITCLKNRGKSNQSKAIENGISEKFLLPTVCKAVDVQVPIFTTSDFEHLRKENKNVFLLNSSRDPDTAVLKYLRKGENEKIHERYLPASRKPWFSLEKRPPSPIWVTVFNRKGVRFIRNEASISNLTTFHCVYLNLFSEPKTDLLMAYLLTDVSSEILGDHRREYGGGLEKFEPNDINNSMIVDLTKLTHHAELKIIQLYKKISNSLRSRSGANDHILSEIDEIFRESFQIEK